MALDVGVAVVAVGAGARGRVIVDVALGVDAAHGGGAWRFAATVVAGFLRRTVRVGGALGPAAGLRIAVVGWQARADGSIARYRALCVEAARAGLAR